MFKDWLQATKNKYAAFAARSLRVMVTIQTLSKEVVAVVVNVTVITSYHQE